MTCDETAWGPLNGGPTPPTQLAYSQAGHGFLHDERPDSYGATAAADAWPRTLSALAQHVRSDWAQPAPPLSEAGPPPPRTPLTPTPLAWA
ncbi:dienelactone hydrolase family protein [Streptomyces sp. NPDC058000]|uniref:dienelactone hydrolase family protein n=1 Tax=Streptomyces sp. NPDC058000 TaxID=3346299 RepID=UPI0036E80704